MSKIALKPNASGTGVFSLEAPDSNTDRTLTLPDEAGSVLTDASDIEPQVKTATNASGDAPVYACRAWVNFDGTGTVSIRESGNVSSITDRGTGEYTVNLSNSLPDDDASVTGIAAGNNTLSTARSANVTAVMNTTTAAYVNVRSGASGSEQDVEFVSVAIFR